MLEQLSTEKRWIHNPARAIKPFIPASTFKIPHTLIALELGIIANVDEIIPWDGTVRRIRSWNRSQSLREAIKNSAVPIYQTIARKIGVRRMSHEIAALGYGNTKVSGSVDQYWLDGPLRISAIQQINFLKQLYRRKLPFRKDVQEDTISVIKRSEGENYVHRGKTGWEIASNPAIGWYIGWHEFEHDVVFFALNMDMTMKGHQKARTSIVLDALKSIVPLDN